MHSKIAPNGCGGCDHRCDDCPDLEGKLEEAEYRDAPHEVLIEDFIRNSTKAQLAHFGIVVT